MEPIFNQFPFFTMDNLFQYCDIVKNSGNYTKNPSTALSDYFKDLNSGEKPLPFTFFVPHGFGKLNGIKVPNTIETNDPKLNLQLILKKYGKNFTNILNYHYNLLN